MSPPRCQTCSARLRWTGVRYYCGRCRTFAVAKATGGQWEVVEPVTGTVMADGTEAEAHEWVHGARTEYRNAGHIPPSYIVRAKATGGAA